MESVRRVSRRTHLFRSNRSLACLPKFVNYTWVASKVLFATNKDDRQTSTEMHNFGNPLKARISSELGMERKKKDMLSPERYQASLESRLRNK